MERESLFPYGTQLFKKKKVNKEILGEALRFIVVGITATIVHYLVYFLLNDVMDLRVAYTIGYITSFLVNYLLSSRYTFKKKTSKKNALGFLSAHVVNYFLQIILLQIFLSLGIGKTLAPLPVYCIVIPTNFMLVRLVFKKLR